MSIIKYDYPPLYFPEEGYHKTELFIEPETLDSLREFAEGLEGWEAIHEKHPEENEKSNDGRKYRFQRKMTSAEKRKGSLRTVIDECKKKLKVVHPIFHVTDTYLLKSLPGGPDQGWHSDYKKEYLETLPAGFFCGTVIVALQDETVVWVKRHKDLEIKLNKGHMMFMKGDLIHAGAAYKTENYRLHFHVGLSKNFKAESNLYF